MFCISIVAFLKGNTFIIVTITSLRPSIGNHMPDKTDCPAIITEDIPPTDFSLHTEPKSIPAAMKNSDVTKLNAVAQIIPTPNNDASNIPPTTKNNTA